MVVRSLKGTIYVDEVGLEVANLVRNPGFELAATRGGAPDGWSTNSHAVRSADLAHSGSFSLRHTGTDNATYSVGQAGAGIETGQSYTLGMWVFIPETSDSFRFALDLQWRNASNRVLRTQRIARLNAGTGGWRYVSGNGTAPKGTTNAVLRMGLSDLAATVYVDDVWFSRAVAGAPARGETSAIASDPLPAEDGDSPASPVQPSPEPQSTAGLHPEATAVVEEEATPEVTAVVEEDAPPEAPPEATQPPAATPTTPVEGGEPENTQQ
jgi:hypothetical protein